jgi:hypothetical protein
LTNNKENRAKISTAGFFIEIDYIVVAKLLKIVGF